MVLIQLKAQYVSLIITVASGIAELCLFGAALGLNRFAECNALKRGKQVSVRRHRARTKFLAIFAMVVFIVLEVVVSFYSNPDFSPETETRNCVAVDRYDRINGQLLSSGANAVVLSCLRIEGDQFIQHVGNRSIPDNDPEARAAEVVCEESALYSSVGEGVVDATISDNQTRTCTAFGCVFTESRGRELRISRALPEQGLDAFVAGGTPVRYLVTSLFFDIDRDQESVLGRRALEAFGDNVSDPMELRRRILTGSEQRSCPFLLSSDPIATEVPLALICIVAITWALSVLALISTLLLKRHIFYDMGDPLHWAQRTFRHIDEPFAENPVVTSVYEHGERLMYVSSSSTDEYDFLKRAVTGFWARLRRSKAPKVDDSVEEQSVGHGAI